MDEHSLLPEAQQTYEGLEMWLKTRRDEYRGGPGASILAFDTIDALLDEVRDAGVEGFLPWQKAL